MGSKLKKLDPAVAEAVKQEFMSADGLWDSWEVADLDLIRTLDYCEQGGKALMQLMYKEPRKPGQPIPKPGEPDGRPWVAPIYSVYRLEDGTYFRKRESANVKSFDPPLDNKIERQKALFGKLGFDAFDRDRSRARNRADRPSMGSRTQYAADQGDRHYAGMRM